jgi:hypothetical protein
MSFAGLHSEKLYCAPELLSRADSNKRGDSEGQALMAVDYCKPNEARTKSRTAAMSTNACSISSRVALSLG